jgi:uncharacterized protein YbbC (DUF1343 family)
VFKKTAYTPKSIPNVAQNPLYRNQRIEGVNIEITDPVLIQPLEIGMHVLSSLAREAERKGRKKLIRNLNMFHKIAGTRRLHRLLKAARSGSEIIADWQREVAAFKVRRKRYLIYRD